MLTAVDIAHHAHGVVAAGSPDAAVSSWAFDSRTLTRGACDDLVLASGSSYYAGLVTRFWKANWRRRSARTIT